MARHLSLTDERRTHSGVASTIDPQKSKACKVAKNGEFRRLAVGTRVARCFSESSATLVEVVPDPLHQMSALSAAAQSLLHYAR